MPIQPIILVFRDAGALAREAAGRIVTSINRAIRDRNVCSIALSGGETPRMVYRILATEEFSRQVDWKRVHVFFGDERLVPPDDPRSNFGMAREALLSRLPIPEENINRIRGELSARDAVDDYRTRLRSFFGDQHSGGSDGPRGDALPRFDLMLLGLGTDGHTASLFPNSAALDVHREIVASSTAPGSSEERVTLTLPVINNSREITALISGKGKAAIVVEVLGADVPVKRLPATMVKPVDGDFFWLLDSAAASLLPVRLQAQSNTP